MSNFSCPKCDTRIIDSPTGYITGCLHYPKGDTEPVDSVNTQGKDAAAPDLWERAEDFCYHSKIDDLTVEHIDMLEAFAQSELTAANAEIERLTKWRIAFELLTPNGSEWVNDLPKCEAYVQQRLLDHHGDKKNLIREKRVTERLRKALEYYAHEGNWRTSELEPGSWTIAKVELTSFHANGFDIAREALDADR